MTETRTPRFNLPQWSSGSDAPSRTDFNGAFADIEARGGYDAGDGATSLPVTNLIAGRTTQLTTASDGYSMYRYNGAAWQYTGGTLVPIAVKHKAMQGQALTATAWTVEHPTRATAALVATYGGDYTAAGVLRSFDTDDDTRGMVVVGWSGTPAANTHGRLHVRTRRSGDLGVVIQAHATAAGNLIAVRESGGQDTFTIDAVGRLTQRQATAFGGGALPTASMVAVAPTSALADGVTNGLLLYGQSSAPDKTILVIQPDVATDTTPIGVVTRLGMTLGRLPWGVPNTATDGLVTLAANTVFVRASGQPANLTYFNVRRSDPTSPATEANAANDTSLLSIRPTGVTSVLPVFVSQRQQQTATTMALYRVGDFAAPFLDLARLVPDGGGGEIAQVAGSWSSDGRISAGAWWRGTGVVRDARQSVAHVSRKSYVTLGGNDLLGQDVTTGQTYTYTWPVMTLRSVTLSQLLIDVGLEFHLLWRTGDGVVDTNGFFVDTLISVNGGGYSTADSSFVTPTPHGSTARNGATNVALLQQYGTSLAVGATITLQTRIRMGASVPGIRLRTLDIRVQEALVESYAAA